MLNWIKQLLGMRLDISGMTLDELDAYGIEMGRKADELRAFRQAIRARADQLRLKRNNGGI